MSTLESAFFGVTAATLTFGAVALAILGHKEAAFWLAMAGAAVVVTAQILWHKLNRRV